MTNQLFTSGLVFDLRSRYRFLIKLIILLAAYFLCSALDTPAQKIRKHKKNISRTVAGKGAVPPKQEKTNEPEHVSRLPISVVSLTETDYLSGEASVAVNPKQPTTLRLGLAQNAVSVIEFPASDGVYYIHEGNPKLVSVFQSPTRESDRSITVYPGESFMVGNKEASATITLQMRSGLILVLEFVPVAGIRNNAHRCVIGYDREEVISTRRAAGLAYNLGDEVNRAVNKNTRATSKLMSQVAAAGDSGGTGDEKQSEETSGSAQIIPAKLTRAEIIRGSISRSKRDEKSNQTTKNGLELSRLVNRRLADCLKDPARVLGEWSNETQGLSVAVSPATEIDASQRSVIVAVRNNSAKNLRLVPGTPELQILTGDEKGKPLQTESLERIYVETTSYDGLVLPGSTVYYALVYQAPVIGASQRLSVLVSHVEAADSPATTLIRTGGVDSTEK